MTMRPTKAWIHDEDNGRAIQITADERGLIIEAWIDDGVTDVLDGPVLLTYEEIDEMRRHAD